MIDNEKLDKAIEFIDDELQTCKRTIEEFRKEKNPDFKEFAKQDVEINQFILDLLQWIKVIEGEKNAIKIELLQAYISGYERGHDDTVESCYGNYEEKADDFVEEAVLRLAKNMPTIEEILEIIYNCIKGSEVWNMLNGKVDLIPLASAIHKAYEERLKGEDNV